MERETWSLQPYELHCFAIKMFSYVETRFGSVITYKTVAPHKTEMKEGRKEEKEIPCSFSPLEGGKIEMRFSFMVLFFKFF